MHFRSYKHQKLSSWRKYHRNTYDFVKYSGITKLEATKLYFDPGHHCQFTRLMRTVKFVKNLTKALVWLENIIFIGVAGVNLIFNCEYYFLLGCSCVNINIVSLCFFHSVHNTIYLEVHCPAVRPHLVVVSDSGRSVVDFANVSLGKIKNILLSSWVASRKRIFRTETLFFHQSAIHQRYSVVHVNFNSQDLIVNSPLWLIHIS